MAALTFSSRAVELRWGDRLGVEVEGQAVGRDAGALLGGVG